MNHRPNLEPAANSPDLIHTSTRTRLCTNVDATGVRAPQTLFSVSKLELRWMDGVVEVRFQSNTIEMKRATPRLNGARR